MTPSQIKTLLLDILNDPKYINYSPHPVQAHLNYLIKDLQSNPNNVAGNLLEVLAYGLYNVAAISDLRSVMKGPTPKEMSEMAYQQILIMQEANNGICEIGACIHKEHHK